MEHSTESLRVPPEHLKGVVTGYRRIPHRTMGADACAALACTYVRSWEDRSFDRASSGAYSCRCRSTAAARQAAFADLLSARRAFLKREKPPFAARRSSSSAAAVATLPPTGSRRRRASVYWGVLRGAGSAPVTRARSAWKFIEGRTNGARAGLTSTGRQRRGPVSFLFFLSSFFFWVLRRASPNFLTFPTDRGPLSLA